MFVFRIRIYVRNVVFYLTDLELEVVRLARLDRLAGARRDLDAAGPPQAAPLSRNAIARRAHDSSRCHTDASWT